MKKLHALLFISLFWGLGTQVMGQGTQAANAQDSLALVAIYNNTNGPRWLNSWNLNNPVRTWQGIDLDGNGNVTILTIPENNVRGAFTGINVQNQLLSLQSLNIADNFVNAIGPLPPSLQSIDISLNRLSYQAIISIQRQFGNIQNLVVQPQKSFGRNVRVSAIEGETVTLSVKNDLTPGNVYTWTNAAGAVVQSGPSNQFTFTGVAISDSGQYQVNLSNPRFQNISFRNDVNVFLRVDPQGTDYESARDSTGQLRAILYLPINNPKRDFVFDTLLPSLNIQPIPGESCLCEEYSMYYFPDTLIGSDGTINIGPQSLINSACEDIEEEGGDFGYDYKIDSLLLPVAGTPINIQLDTSLLSVTDTVNVSIIDLGIDSSHHALRDYLTGDDSKISCIANDNLGYNFYADNTNPFDVQSSHGTHVAGIVTSFIPDLPVKIMSIQVGKSGDDTRLFDIVCGIKYSILQEVDLINLSMGYVGPESNLLKRVLTELQTSPGQTRLITSAGNKNLDMSATPSWPAAFSSMFPAHVIAVGAMNEAYDSLANFSNYSDNLVSIAAPGTKIYSTINGGDYGYMDGTSMAAPFVTAVFAYMKSSGELGPLSNANKLIQEPTYAIDELNLAGLINLNKKLKVSIDNCMDVPFARDDFFKVVNGQARTIEVRRNDCPVTGLTPNIVANVDAADGTLVVNADGTLTFTPTATNKEVTFTYELCSASSVCNPATVTLSIGEGDAPDDGGNYWWWIILLLILMFIFAYFILNRST